MAAQIFTSVVNRPDFLDYQARLFRKHLAGDVRFNVVDDSVDESLAAQFRELCDIHGLNYHRKPERFRGRTPSDATAEAIQWTFDSIIKVRHGTDNVLFLDSDMFLVASFDIDAYLEGYTIGGLLQRRDHVIYLWNGIMFFNMPAVLALGGDLDFSAGRVDGRAVDTGGQLYHFIHREGVRLRETDPDYKPQYPESFRGIDLEGAGGPGGYAFELHCERRFLHYRAASNWFSNWRGTADPLPGKTDLLERIMGEVL